jgi:hypothetical protein
MLNRCKELKKLLRGSDLLLKRARVAAYDEQKQAMVQEAKTTLTAAMRHFDMLLVTLTAERAAAGAAGGDSCGSDHDVSMSSDGSEVDQELLDYTTKRVISWQAEYRILMNKIEELCADKPVHDQMLTDPVKMLLIISNEAAVRSKDGANITAALHKCRAYREEREIQENIATLHTQ